MSLNLRDFSEKCKNPLRRFAIYKLNSGPILQLLFQISTFLMN